MDSNYNGQNDVHPNAGNQSGVSVHPNANVNSSMNVHPNLGGQMGHTINTGSNSEFISMDNDMSVNKSDTNSSSVELNNNTFSSLNSIKTSLDEKSDTKTSLSSMENMTSGENVANNPYSSGIGSQNPYSSATGSQNPYGSNVGGQNPYSSSVGSQNPYSSSAGSQNPYSSSVGSQNPYSSSAGSQNPYSSSAGSQNPYSSSAGGHNPYSSGNNSQSNYGTTPEGSQPFGVQINPNQSPGGGDVTHLSASESTAMANESKYSSTSGTMYADGGSGSNGNGVSKYKAPFAAGNPSYRSSSDSSFAAGSGGINFEGEAVDMTDPSRMRKTQSQYNDMVKTEKLSQTPFIIKLTGFFVYLAMIGAVGFALYLFQLGEFEFMSKTDLMIKAGIAMYSVFAIDAFVMMIFNKSFSILLFALILPIFYPIKRSSVTYSRKNIALVWLLAFGVIGGFVFSNEYPQIREQMLLVKNSADEYPSTCDEAVRFVKDLRANSEECNATNNMRGVTSDKFIVEIIREKYDNYVWDAKVSGSSYDITVKGDTRLQYTVGTQKFTADQVGIKDNTIITFHVSKTADSFVLNGISEFTFNGDNQIGGASAAWQALCAEK